MFDTFGPISLSADTPEAIKAFYEDMGVEHSYLVNSFGVYIVAAKDRAGKLVPFYVGKTALRSFGTRLGEHFNVHKFSEASKNGLQVFFLAVAKDGKPLTFREAGTAVTTKAISYLEVLLIGACLKLNPALANKQQKRFHDLLRVPGFNDNGEADCGFRAAKELSALLNPAGTVKPLTARGKYSNTLPFGSNVAVIDPDLSDRFPDSASVNKALRTYLTSLNSAT